MPPGPSGGGGWDARRTPLALPSSVTRGPGPIICRQSGAREDTVILRVNGLPGEGQVWLIQVQGQTTPGAGGFLFDARRDDFAIVRWAVGNTWQEVEADLPAAGISVPVLAEAIEVTISRRGTVPAPDLLYSAAMSSAIGSPRAAKLTRTIEASAAAVGASDPNRIPPKATEVQFSFDGFAFPATTTVTIDVEDSAGVKVGDTFTVYKVGEELVDPDSGMSLGVEETAAGQLQISKAMPKFSIGAATSGTGFRQGDVIREK